MKSKLLLIISIFVVTGCTVPDVFNDKSSSGTAYKQISDANLINESQKAGEQLIGQASYLRDDLRAILVTSVANITDLDSSSALGLTISEQIANRFVQEGFPVVDLRTRSDIKVRENNGEYILSRDIQKIGREHSAAAVLIGTYSVAQNNVFVSTRLVRPEDNRVLASYDFKLPLGPDTKKLVTNTTK